MASSSFPRVAPIRVAPIRFAPIRVAPIRVANHESDVGGDALEAGASEEGCQPCRELADVREAPATHRSVDGQADVPRENGEAGLAAATNAVMEETGEQVDDSDDSSDYNSTRILRVNQRLYRKGRRCDACREVQRHRVCLVEVADNGFVHQCGRWESFGDDEELEVYKLCQVCFVQAQGLLDGGLIWAWEA